MYVRPIPSSVYTASERPSTRCRLLRSLSFSRFPAKPTPTAIRAKDVNRPITKKAVVSSPLPEAEAMYKQKVTNAMARPPHGPSSNARSATQGSSIAGPTV